MRLVWGFYKRFIMVFKHSNRHITQAKLFFTLLSSQLVGQHILRIYAHKLLFTGINEVSVWSFGPETPISNKNQVERRVSRVNTSPSSRHSHFKYFSPYVVVNVCGSQKIVDLTMLEPYLKILTHGGMYVYFCNKYFNFHEPGAWRLKGNI